MSLTTDQIKINLKTFISSYMMSKNPFCVDLMLSLIKEVMQDTNEFVVSDNIVLKKDPSISDNMVDIMVDNRYLMSVVTE